MFGLRHYTVLLSEVFDTGYSSDDLLARLQAFLAAENEPIRPFSEASSELYVILNSNRVMYAFTRIMGGEVRLHFCFRMQAPRLQRVDFIRLATPEGCCLGIRLDGIVACAVSNTASDVHTLPASRTRH